MTFENFPGTAPAYGLRRARAPAPLYLPAVSNLFLQFAFIMEIKKFLEFLSPFAILLVIIVERRLSLLKNEGSVVMKRLAARLLSLMGVFVLCLGVMGSAIAASPVILQDTTVGTQTRTLCNHAYRYLERTETQYVYSGALNRTYKYIIEYYRCADCGYTYPVTIDCGWVSGEVVGW